MRRSKIFAAVSVLLCALATTSADVRQEIHFPDLPGYQTLECDFHSHTVFSDGSVWPTVRINEAWREGLDTIAIRGVEPLLRTTDDRDIFERVPVDEQQVGICAFLDNTYLAFGIRIVDLAAELEDFTVHRGQGLEPVVVSKEVGAQPDLVERLFLVYLLIRTHEIILVTQFRSVLFHVLHVVFKGRLRL